MFSTTPFTIGGLSMHTKTLNCKTSIIIMGTSVLTSIAEQTLQGPLRPLYWCMQQMQSKTMPWISLSVCTFQASAAMMHASAARTDVPQVFNQHVIIHRWFHLHCTCKLEELKVQEDCKNNYECSQKHTKSLHKTMIRGYNLTGIPSQCVMQTKTVCDASFKTCSKNCQLICIIYVPFLQCHSHQACLHPCWGVMMDVNALGVNRHY